jgi:hypothetical protein
VPGTGWHPVPYPGDPVPVIPAGTELYFFQSVRSIGKREIFQCSEQIEKKEREIEKRPLYFNIQQQGIQTNKSEINILVCQRMTFPFFQFPFFNHM